MLRCESSWSALTVFRVVLLGACLLGLGSCGGGHIGAVQAGSDRGPAAGGPLADSAASPLTQLPAPAALLRQSSTTPGDIERLKAYNYWEQGLPNARMDNGKFQPIGSGGPDRLDQAAYCIYRFEQLDTYDTPQQLLFSWLTAPQDGHLFIGLSDFSSNRWEWHSPADNTRLSLDSFAPYISSGGSTLVAVVVTGSQQAEIAWMIAGGSVISTLNINSNLSFNPQLNTAPLTIDFSVYSNVYGGAVSSYEWDFDDDGVIDQSGTETQASHSFTDPGLYTVMLRATAGDGTQETEFLQFTAVDPSNAGPSASVETSPLVSDGPDEITLDAGGSSDPDGQIIKYEWDFNNDGLYDYDSGPLASISHFFARKGLIFYKVRVTDNDYATATALGAVTINSGWSTATVSFGYGYIYSISAATTGTGSAERPCLAFNSANAVDLHFVRAGQADGSDWEAVQAPIDNSGSVGIAPALLRSSLTGNPLLFYSVVDSSANSLSLHLVKAGNSAGTVWNPPIDIDTELNVGARTCAFMQDGVPALFSSCNELGTGRQIYYYKAGDASAQDWNFRRLAATTPEGNFFSGLAGAYGESPAAFTVVDDNFPGYSRALTPDGENWSDFTGLDPMYCPQISATTVNGAPAIAQLHHEQIHYRRADDASGSSWTAEPVIIEGPKAVYPAALKVIAGKPALAWMSSDGDGIYLVEATDANGADWSAPYAIVTSTGLGDALDFVECQGNPVVIYSNQEDDTIEAAFYIP